MLSSRRLLTAAGAVAGLIAGSVAAAAPAQAAPPAVPAAASAVPFTSRSTATADVDGSQQLTIELWLKPDVTAAQNYAGAVSTPGNASFRHYLSPSAYTARFGPTAGQVSTVESWLRGQGFTGVTADSQRSFVRASAPVSEIDAAFNTQLKLYRASVQANAGPYPLRANDSALTLPPSLAGSVLGVTGLDNAAPALPLQIPSGPVPMHSAAQPAAQAARPADAPVAGCSSYYGEYSLSGLPPQFGATSFPLGICGYSAAQVRAAYGASPAAAGKGQTIALVELGLTQDMFSTLQDYAAANAMPTPSSERYSELALGGNNDCGDPFDIEEQLDVEASYDMAPDASQIVVGGDACDTGDFGLQGLFDADTAVLGGTGNHPLASIASNSWASGDENQPAGATGIEHAILVRAAAEGVGMYFSAGDGSGVLAPADDPDAIAVGGTSLGLGQAGNRLFETGWSTDLSIEQNGQWADQGENGATGGGPSTLWAQPGYQEGVVPASMSTALGNRGGGPVRAVPDISADADPSTGFAVGLLTFGANPTASPAYSEEDVGGTSLAAPLVAGMVAAAQQGQHKPFGFINPAIYQLYGTDAFHDALPLTASSPVSYRAVACPSTVCQVNKLNVFDDQGPGMVGWTGQVTAKGYDTMTGVGTPNGMAFIAALRKLG